MTPTQTEEERRLASAARREENWQRWGPYLAERQWATVREDYSRDGTVWDYFPHDHARSRAYRWGEDGLLGITDRECRLCFALALWNGNDPILKERLFGLTGPEGNHGEDVKECYFYLDSTPTHSFMKALYRYPQAAYPYARLVEENGRRGPELPEFELLDTGVLDGGRFFDVTVEYAKAAPDDILVRITVANRAQERARLHLLPTLWFRNTWSWGSEDENTAGRPSLARGAGSSVDASHATLGSFRLVAGPAPDGSSPELLFTENETNQRRLFGAPDPNPWVKDAFHRYLVGGERSAVNPLGTGTKAAFHYTLTLEPGGAAAVRLRLTDSGSPVEDPLGAGFDGVVAARLADADAFFASRIPAHLGPDARVAVRQAYAGLAWNKQFYHYVVQEWLRGDPAQPPPPPERLTGRNHDWTHIYNRDVLSMPDCWEYPWYAAWDLAFQTLPIARVDPEFAKGQLVLLLREWYMHPSGQIPAYEFAFSDVNPPVHAWAAWRVYKITGPRGSRDRLFLERVFQKLLLNFTWWVNRKDPAGNHLFSGGFLGLDNIGVFDRSRPLPTGGFLEQADGTAWMASYCATMLAIALELAGADSAYEDVASKFFEHFVAIADAMNTFGGSGLWDDEDGFYYDQLMVDGRRVPLRVRSLVGLVPLIAVEVLEDEVVDRLPGFKRRLDWFLAHRADLSRHITYMATSEDPTRCHRLLAIPSRERLRRVLGPMLDASEFLSPYGIRSLSRYHLRHPFVLPVDGHPYSVRYEPGESASRLFGGNSNWRGPVWLPLNYLLVEALERYHHFYGDDFTVECPTGSGTFMNLAGVAHEITRRVASLFLRGPDGRRPCHGGERRFADDPLWRDALFFHEYFDGDTGRGLGASHQTGWTALAARFIETLGAGEAPE